jgi:hypothetical protein
MDPLPLFGLPITSESLSGFSDMSLKSFGGSSEGSAVDTNTESSCKYSQDCNACILRWLIAHMYLITKPIQICSINDHGDVQIFVKLSLNGSQGGTGEQECAVKALILRLLLEPLSCEGSKR